MKNQLLATLMIVAGSMSCSPGPAPSASVVTPTTGGPTAVSSSENVTALQQQFQGKYKVISSVSSEPVDIDLDGTASADLLHEMTELAQQSGTRYFVELTLHAPSPATPKPNFLFVQWWPEQFIRIGAGKVWDGGELINYNPELVVKYDFQGTYRNFTLSSDLRQLAVLPDATDNPYRWVRPELVTVDGNERLRVITKRRLYTRSGVKEVSITTVYERFSRP
ncbi:hypothetical protein [Fibrella forsythiae]|uniref:Lipoprotein n=1 Tax=Fibrella forsythiae TaxID=2817061 RepID=A0ABS3JD97_9BACT|nr:hypothetical protein [Fibrella forsythiae]MBO0947974.1 hypothetical protein [Fibrella forsythiae]